MWKQASPREQRRLEGQLTSEDEQFLDEVLDRAVQLLHAGETPTPAELASERPELLAEVRAQVEVACTIVPRMSGTIPTITGYTVLREVGRGGMGTVYLARQERLGGRAVALKVLSASSSMSPAARRRFRQEAESIARLHHPSIVAVHDVVAEASIPAFAMEWIEGRSLSSIIEHVKKSDPAGSSRVGPHQGDRVRAFVTGEEEGAHDVAWEPTYTIMVCRIGIAIARALAVVHDAGMLHRDVKPSNILIRRDGTALLADFGLAREAEPSETVVTQAGQFVGTPAYAPPEQLRGEGGAVDARSDVYSLGVTLYHALALRLPFEGPGAGDIQREVELGRSTALRRLDPRIPRDLETIISKAMEVEPARRYQTAKALADDLERLVTMRPIDARRPGVLGRAWKTARRNRAALAGAVVGAMSILVLTLGALAYATVVPRRVEDEIRAARVGILDPERVDRLGGSATKLRKSRGALRPVFPTNLDQVVHHYDSALRWAPWREDIRLEREAVAAAREASRLGAPRSLERVSPIITRRAPMTAAYLTRLSEVWGTSPAMFAESALPEDLRTLGLIAFLIEDGERAYAAWERLSLDTRPDALIQGALGELDFQRREWASMYTRLEKAADEFPGAPLLRLQLADAALHVGRVADAQRLLDQVGPNPRGRTFDTRRRVLAGLHARRGEDAQAVEQFEFFRHAREHPAAREEYGRFLMARGRFRDATVVFQEMCALRPQRPMFRRLFLESCRAWLANADEGEEAAARSGALPSMPRGECAFAFYEALVADVASLPEATPPLASARSRSMSDGTLPRAMDWLLRHIDDHCVGPRTAD